MFTVKVERITGASPFDVQRDLALQDDVEDVNMETADNAGAALVTPGQVITEDAQFMR
jgi:hypothetical protein